MVSGTVFVVLFGSAVIMVVGGMLLFGALMEFGVFMLFGAFMVLCVVGSFSVRF